MSERKKFEENQPGMDEKKDVPNENYQHTREAAQSGNQGRASFAAGSTTQGGSNHGQGSHYLAGDRYHQGEQKNEGSNYENEAGKFNTDEPTGDIRKDEHAPKESVKGKLGEHREDIPHGQGAHINEKERNAQEDYPGTESSTENDAAPERT